MNTGWRKNYLRYKSYFLDVMGKYKERSDIKAYLEILLSLATISIFSIFALRPTLLTIAELIKEIQTEKQTLNSINQKIVNLSQAQSLYNSQRVQISQLESSIPKVPSPNVYAKQIEGLSQAHQVVILEMKTGEATILGKDSESEDTEKDSEPFPKDSQKLTFSFKGRVGIEQYQNLVNFLKDLENNRLITKIDLVKLNSVNDPTGKYLLLTIEGKLPYYRGK